MKICKMCNKEFIGHWLTVYCSNECRVYGKKIIKLEFYSRNIELTKERSRIRYIEKNEGVKKQSIIYRDKNKDIILQKKREYKKTPRGKALTNSNGMKRKTQKLQATPVWLTTEQLEQITQFYIESVRLTIETGIEHQVDHIVPLLGKNVRGLHVPWNLQIITKTENMIKGNRI